MDIFDKIINGEIPSYKIYEDQDIFVFLDISQMTKGHALLVPKKHLENIFDYDDEDAAKILSKLPMIAQAIKKSDKNIIGMNIISNNGEAAGQSVFHSHWHLIPRYQDDGVNIEAIDNSANYTPEDLLKIAEQIKGEINE